MTIDSPTIELIDNWRHEAELAEPGLPTLFTMTKKQLKHIATKAAQWGADQELEVMRKPSMSDPTRAALERLIELRSTDTHALLGLDWHEAFAAAPRRLLRER